MNKETNSEYLINEANYLRESFDTSAKEIGMLERYALLTTGTIWAWIVSNVDNSAFNIEYIIWLPLFIQVLFGLRAWSVYNDMRALLNYISEIEKSFKLTSNLGWAQYWTRNRSKYRSTTGYVFWIILNLATILIATLVTFP